MLWQTSYNSDRVVSPSKGFSVDMHRVTPTSFCNEVKKQVAPVCITGSRLYNLGSGYAQWIRSA